MTARILEEERQKAIALYQEKLAKKQSKAELEAQIRQQMRAQAVRELKLQQLHESPSPPSRTTLKEPQHLRAKPLDPQPIVATSKDVAPVSQTASIRESTAPSDDEDYEDEPKPIYKRSRNRRKQDPKSKVQKMIPKDEEERDFSYVHDHTFRNMVKQRAEITTTTMTKYTARKLETLLGYAVDRESKPILLRHIVTHWGFNGHPEYREFYNAADRAFQIKGTLLDKLRGCMRNETRPLIHFYYRRKGKNIR